MDRQRQTDYTVKPREDTIMMQTLYKLYYSYTIVIVISGQWSTNIRFNGTIWVQKLFLEVGAYTIVNNVCGRVTRCGGVCVWKWAMVINLL